MQSNHDEDLVRAVWRDVALWDRGEDVPDSLRFTREHVQRILDVRKEIEWVEGIVEPERGIPEQRRILARLKSTLSTFERGVRPAALADLEGIVKRYEGEENTVLK